MTETGLLPHLNPGVMTREDVRELRRVSVSLGLMLETTSERLSARGGPHFGSPDKLPARRLETIAAAGEERVPFTTGLLIGIGESREERIDALLAIRELADTYGHVQEVIVQNFRAKPGTRMAGSPEPALEELLWTIAVARIVLGPHAHLQAPPNLSYTDFPRLLDAGIDDWGGVSPVTIDHVNPEAPWPELELLRAGTESRGLELAPRLPVYPEWISGRMDRPERAAGGSARIRFARACARGPLVAGRGRWRSRSSRGTRCRSTLVQSSARRRSCACSARAGTSATASLRPPISSGARSAATR